jgi:hypothetical protein
VFDVSNLVDPRSYGVFKVEDVDLARLKKTSIDYTLCDEHDVPSSASSPTACKTAFTVGAKCPGIFPEMLFADFRRLFLPVLVPNPILCPGSYLGTLYETNSRVEAGGEKGNSSTNCARTVLLTRILAAVRKEKGRERQCRG